MANKKQIEVVAKEPQTFVIQRERFDSRKGMWVTTPIGVGILTGPDEATIVKEDGTTKLVLNDDNQVVARTMKLETITQAYIEDIPVSRRPQAEVLYALGYQHRI